MKRSITEKIDNITTMKEQNYNVVQPIPKSVKIELTARCDFACSFCATSKNFRKKDDMSLEDFTRIITELREVGVEELGLFFLGESMIYQHLPEAIRIAKEDLKFPYVFLTTNGRAATPDKVEACLKAGLDSLKFSFNNANPEQFEKITRRKGSGYYKVVENIKSAYKIRENGEYDCGIFASSIKYDGEQQIMMEKAVSEIINYVDEHYWLPLYGHGMYALNDAGEPTPGNMGRLDNLQQPLPCWTIFTEGHITHDGRLAACCFDHNNSFDMGNLNEVSFKEAWNSKKFQDLRQAHLNKNVTGTPCQNCMLL